MKLDEYIQQRGITQKKFISELNQEYNRPVSQGALTKWIGRQRIPRYKDMRIIYVATDGKVTPNDFYDL
tara:strand:+ start:277 stop:483 length:207 start_codon:yes stop_codon:yes gene_type:complete